MSHRLQILIDEDRYQRVAAIAAQRRTSVASVIREAIDRGLGDPDASRGAAIRDILDAAPMDVPADVAELVSELEGVRGRHT